MAPSRHRRAFAAAPRAAFFEVRMPIFGHNISQEMLDAVGLPKHVVAFNLHVRAGAIATVDCEYYPADQPALERAFASYTLEPRPAAAPAHPTDLIGFDAWMRQRTDRAHAQFMRRTACLPSTTAT